MRILVSLVFTAVLAGCAHPIQINPDPGKLSAVLLTENRANGRVAFYIAPTVAAAEVTTAGGGGDNVRYFPYRDIELGFQRILSNVFGTVEKIDMMPASTEQGKYEYVVTPVLVTSSGGSGFFTWPPTNFTADLTSQIRDKDGKLIASPRVVGTGTAETGERLSDHGFAGKRALEDALNKMQKALVETDLVGASAKPKSSANGSVEERLRRIKELRDNGTITEQEYESRRKAIVDAL